MGKIKPPEPALLFTGTLYTDPEIFNRTKELLENKFGHILFESPPLPWDYSSYYRYELGCPILRQFLFFKDPVDPGTLADVKIVTNEIEGMFSVDGKRRINLDPGYLTLSKIVLASTKNYSHRIYLGKGIYGEITLMYRYKEGTFKPHLFTYRDYQSESCVDIFLNVREMLKRLVS